MLWLIGGAVLFLTVGFAKLVVSSLNRSLSFPHSIFWTIVLHLLHAISIPAYLAILVREVVYNPGLISPGSATGISVSPSSMILVTLGVIGLAMLIRSTIKFRSIRPPECQTGFESEVIDVRRIEPGENWRTNLVGPGPMRGIALLPGNEQFTLEVNSKTFTLPNLPAQWDGLSIVQIADTHFRGAVSRRYFEVVCEHAAELGPDLFVFTGDLLDDQALLEWVPQTLGRLSAPLGQYFILGNHDSYLDHVPIRQELIRCGWTDVAGRSLTIPSQQGGPALMLAGDETPWIGQQPDLANSAQSLFRILLSHTPDNIAWALNNQVDLMISGHTHGGQIRLPVLGPIHCPSRYGLQFSAGEFWLDPTLLHVSRGLSGREPIRYGCRPELTRLILRAPAADSTT